MQDSERNERRRFHRILMDQNVILTAEGLRHTAVVVDISLKGMLAMLMDDWRPQANQVLEAEVQLEEGQDCCIRFSGEVRHLDGNLVGLHALSIDLDSITRLRRMVELNLQDHDLLERELAHMMGS